MPSFSTPAPAAYPPIDATQASAKNCTYGAGEERVARLNAPSYRQQRAGLIKDAFGGEAKVVETLKASGGDWAELFPGPHHEDVLGAWDLFFESGIHGDQHLLIKEWSDKYAPAANWVVPAFMFDNWEEKKDPRVAPEYFIIVNHPEDHLKVATEHVPKSAIYSGSAIGRNFLMHTDREEWQRRRFNMLWAVAPLQIKTYFHKMERHAHILIDRLLDDERGTYLYGATEPLPAFNIHDMVETTAFAIAADCLFGLPDDKIAQWSHKVRWAFQSQDAGNAKVVSIVKDWANVLSAHEASAHGPVLKALTEERERHSEKWGGPATAFSHDAGIISLAMHDTTASTMTWCLMELARRPKLQSAVAAEARAVLSDRGNPRAMTYDDMYKMPLLTKCINETLRLHPAVGYGSMRALDKDEWLHVGQMGSSEKVLVPKGTTVFIHNFANHRSKKLWGPDADEWKPERWQGFADVDALNFEGPDGPDGWKCTYSARNPQSLRFHPFTRAPRDCFGKNFAQAEMRVVLPVLLSRLKFRLAEPSASRIATQGPDHLSFQIAGIVKPRDGLWMHVTQRPAGVHAQSQL